MPRRFRPETPNRTLREFIRAYRADPNEFPRQLYRDLARDAIAELRARRAARRR
jgi:hypothetical protein